MMLSAAKEKRQHGSMQVPYSYYDCRMPDYFPGVPLHWHGEMELNYIKRGTGYFQYEDRLLTAHAGDIFLIQLNLVHAILPAEQESMFYDTIVFHQNMLIGGYDDRSYTEILQPFFSARRRIQAPISPEHSGYAALSASVHQIFRCIRENSAVSDLLLKSELLRFFYLRGAAQYDAECVRNRVRQWFPQPFQLQPAVPKQSGMYAADVSEGISKFVNSKRDASKYASRKSISDPIFIP